MKRKWEKRDYPTHWCLILMFYKNIIFSQVYISLASKLYRHHFHIVGQRVFYTVYNTFKLILSLKKNMKEERKKNLKPSFIGRKEGLMIILLEYKGFADMIEYWNYFFFIYYLIWKLLAKSQRYIYRKMWKLPILYIDVV